MDERRKKYNLSRLATSEDLEKMQKLSQNKLKSNKLSRGLRQTQQSPSFELSYNCHKDLKTPKRHTRIRHNACNNADSPSNDSDLQQDIIWDPTSPPVCNGKGVKKTSGNMRVVDISEIVKRIAPKDERPAVPESSLLQWIGDSAIPCTPEVRQPRTRKKSARQTDVEDLMKLAKQFDYNMHQQDKEHIKEALKESAEEDTDNLRGFGGQENNPPSSLSEVPTTSKGTAFQLPASGGPTTAGPKPADQEMDDDLDALFDGPTQHINRRLSQASSTHSQEGKALPGEAFTEDVPSGNRLNLGPGGTSAGPSAHVKNQDGFSNMKRVVDDDWDDDDLLNDSLVLEMTQNPDLFAAPKHCSTQIGQSPKQNDFVKRPSASNGSPGRLPQGSSGNGFGGPCQGKIPKFKNRSTFKLETNPNFQVKETLSGEEPTSSHSLVSGKLRQGGGVQNRQKSLFQSNQVESVHQNNQKTKPLSREGGNRVQRPVMQHGSSTFSGSWAARKVQTGNEVSVVHTAVSNESNHVKATRSAGTAKERPTDTKVSVADEDDLDRIFASDSLWDDGDDDDLLCQVCEDVEKLSQSQAPSSGPADQQQNGPKGSLPSAAAKGPTAQNSYKSTEGGNRGLATGQPQAKPQCTFSRSHSMPGNSATYTKAMPQASAGIRPTTIPSGPRVPNKDTLATNNGQTSASWPQAAAGGFASKGPYRFTQLKRTESVGGAIPRTAVGQQCAGNNSSTKNAGSSHHHSFKRHLSDPVALTNKVFVSNQATGKCSEAEIERKKREAMARRRLRMQSAQGPPT